MMPKFIIKMKKRFLTMRTNSYTLTLVGGKEGAPRVSA
jgi:hypothetical protein